VRFAVVVGKVVATAGGLKTVTLVGNDPPELRSRRSVFYRNLFCGIKAIAMFGGIDEGFLKP
jgi:hypothetical protein